LNVFRVYHKISQFIGNLVFAAFLVDFAPEAFSGIFADTASHSPFSP